MWLIFIRLDKMIKDNWDETYDNLCNHYDEDINLSESASN